MYSNNLSLHLPCSILEEEEVHVATPLDRDAHHKWNVCTVPSPKARDTIDMALVKDMSRGVPGVVNQEVSYFPERDVWNRGPKIIEENMHGVIEVCDRHFFNSTNFRN